MNNTDIDKLARIIDNPVTVELSDFIEQLVAREVEKTVVDVVSKINETVFKYVPTFKEQINRIALKELQKLQDKNQPN